MFEAYFQCVLCASGVTSNAWFRCNLCAQCVLCVSCALLARVGHVSSVLEFSIDRLRLEHVFSVLCASRVVSGLGACALRVIGAEVCACAGRVIGRCLCSESYWCGGLRSDSALRVSGEES